MSKVSELESIRRNTSDRLRFRCKDDEISASLTLNTSELKYSSGQNLHDAAAEEVCVQQQMVSQCGFQ
jgi:hypothetical protein